MRIWSWTVDDWNAAFQGFAILCIAGTLLAGAGKFWTDRIIKERHAQELAAAKTRTVKVEVDLAKQQERTAKAEKELRERFESRTLTQNQQTNFFGLARAYAPLAKEARDKRGETVWIVHPTGDPEATEFASMLTHLLFEAGWPVQIRDIPFPVHRIGIAILVNDPANPPSLVQPLQQLFEQAGISVSVRQEQDLDKRIFLQVGSRQ
jgi:hypothetical protein